MKFSGELIDALETRLRIHGTPELEEDPQAMFEIVLGRLLLGQEPPLMPDLSQQPPSNVLESWGVEELTTYAALHHCLGLSAERVAQDALAVISANPTPTPSIAECAIGLTAMLGRTDELRRWRMERLRMPTGPIAFEALYLSKVLLAGTGMVDDLDSMALTFARIAFEALALHEADGLDALVLVLAGISMRNGVALPALCSKGVHRLDAEGYAPFATTAGSLMLGEMKLAVHPTEGGGSAIQIRCPLKGKGRLSTIEHALPELLSGLPATWERLCRVAIRSRRKADTVIRQMLDALPHELEAIRLDLALVRGKDEVGGDDVYCLQERFEVAVEHLRALAGAADAGSPPAWAGNLKMGLVTILNGPDNMGIHGRFSWSHTYRLDEPAYQAAYLPDGNAFAVLTGGTRMRFLGTREFEDIRKPVDCGEAIFALTIHPEGTLLACATAEDVRLYDLHDRLWRTTRLDASEPRTLCFLHGGRELLVVSEDGDVQVWPFDRDDAATRIFEIPDGERAVLAAGGNAMAWTISGKEIEVISPIAAVARRRTLRPGSVTTMALSPDGRLLAVGQQGGAIELWSVEGERRIGRLTGHRNAVSSLAFSHDGRALVSTAEDGKVHLWDTTMRRARLDVLECPYRFDFAAFSPSGTTIALTTLNGPVVLIRVILL